MRTPFVATLALVGLSVLACGDGRPEGAWVRADLVTLPEGVSPAALPDPGSRGADLAVEYCAQCHGVPSPKRHSPSDWVPTLRRMFARMDHLGSMGGRMGGRGMRGGDRGRMPMGMHGVDVPSEAEKAALVAYYTTHALRSVEAEALPPGEGIGRFRDRCSRCHALPDPGLHPPSEWPAVVQRMRENMERAGVEGLSDAEADAIATYLREAASRESTSLKGGSEDADDARFDRGDVPPQGGAL